MSHDPELLAAAYLTTMRPRARRRFDVHLLACEQCWQEVTLARRGRHLAETARDLAPAGLRENIRTAVATAAALPPADQRPRIRLVAATVMAAAILAGIATVVGAWPHVRQGGRTPAVIAAAVTSYRSGRLPGTAVPAAAPDLTSLDLHLTGAARGEIGGLTVTTFAYAAPSGERVTIIRSSRPFPEASTARELGGTDDAWTARSRGVIIICAQRTHAMLLLGSDSALLRQASALLNAI
jgi:hypothetical protein